MTKKESSKPSIMKCSSTDIKLALRDRYPGGQYALMFEVSNGTGLQIKRYADAVAMGMWASHGMEVEGIEIKISRSDFKNELKDHQKSDEIMRYCNRWWLAAPKGLVMPDELPSTWGLIELHENGVLRQKVAAPKLSPIPLDKPFIAAMLRRGAQHDVEETGKLIAKGIAEAEIKIKERYERKFKDDVGSRARQLEQAEKAYKDIKEKTGIDLMDYTPSANTIALMKFADKFMLESNWRDNRLDKLAASMIDIATQLNSIFPAIKITETGGKS